jgi:hypothetical protein
MIAPRLHAPADQGAGLQPLEAHHRVEIDALAMRKQIQHLAARHSGRSGGLGKLNHQLGADFGAGVGTRVAQYLEPERQQGIAGEHCRGFVEGAMHGRLAAAEIVIVHARQIVVDERMDVHAFHRDCRSQRIGSLDLEERRGGNHKERPKPLPATDGCVAHRLMKPTARIRGVCQQGTKQCVHFRRRGAHGGADREGRSSAKVGHVQPIRTGLKTVLSLPADIWSRTRL